VSFFLEEAVNPESAKDSVRHHTLVSTGGAAKPPPSGPPRATYCATASAMFGCSGVCSVGGDSAGCRSDD